MVRNQPPGESKGHSQEARGNSMRGQGGKRSQTRSYGGTVVVMAGGSRRASRVLHALYPPPCIGHGARI